MAEVKLKRKITLKHKQDPVVFTFKGKLKINLYWTSDTDLDLCLFFRKKDGAIGGVFSDLYNGKKSDLGTLDKFPFIEHQGDITTLGPNGEAQEEIWVAKLDDIDEAFACIINYGAAIEGEDVTYAQEGGRIEIKSDDGDYLEVLADSADEGHVYCVCSIKNKGDGNFALKNESRVMSLGDAFEQIPGFSLIVNEV